MVRLRGVHYNRQTIKDRYLGEAKSHNAVKETHADILMILKGGVGSILRSNYGKGKGKFGLKEESLFMLTKIEVYLEQFGTKVSSLSKIVGVAQSS